MSGLNFPVSVLHPFAAFRPLPAIVNPLPLFLRKTPLPQALLCNRGPVIFMQMLMIIILAHVDNVDAGIVKQLKGPISARSSSSRYHIHGSNRSTSRQSPKKNNDRGKNAVGDKTRLSFFANTSTFRSGPHSRRQTVPSRRRCSGIGSLHHRIMTTG